MARYQKQRNDYPMGSISSGTMRTEDLIPDFAYTLRSLLRFTRVSRATRKAHMALLREIDAQPDGDEYYESEEAGYDLEALFDALGEYAAPYFYFGAHPGDGADYGFWLSEDWDCDFKPIINDASGLHYARTGANFTRETGPHNESIKVSDMSEVPAWFRGEVAVVNDHGNVTLYVKTSRTLREIWAVV